MSCICEKIFANNPAKITCPRCGRKISITKVVSGVQVDYTELEYLKHHIIAAKTYPELSAGVTLLTSLSRKPKHLGVQARCLDSWLRVGCKIVAQNTRDEIDQLRPEYPQVHEWVECEDVSTEYDYPTQRLYNLAKTASEIDAAIINSDIEILSTQKKLIEFVSASHNEFVLGIRWNYGNSPASAREFEWGMDLITISQEQLLQLPADMPFSIGQPMWDYALPELLIRAGFTAKIPHEPILFHRDHPQHWNEHSHKLGKDWLSKYLGKKFNDVVFRRNLDPNYLYSKDQGKYLYNHWLPLHRYPVEHADDWDERKANRWYYNEWLQNVPNIGCSCEPHWRELTKKHPPDFSSPKTFFEWGWARHDDVSREHSKRPQITLAEAYEIYWLSNKP